MNILFRLCINKLSAGKWLQKKITINCLVLKRQLVVLEVEIIFSSRRKKLLKIWPVHGCLDGLKKNSISALFQSILRGAPLQSKYSSSEWINTKEKELTGIVQWKRYSFKFESPSVSVVECPPLDATPSPLTSTGLSFGRYSASVFRNYPIVPSYCPNVVNSTQAREVTKDL